MRLAISLATRGRPEKLLKQVETCLSNWTHPETKMWIQVDEDDQPTIDLCERQGWYGRFHPPIFVSVEPREDTVAAKWNRIITQTTNADVLMYHADDDPYISKGYDQRVLDAAARFPDGIGAVFGHLANLSFSCTYAATRKYVEKLGFLLPDYFPYWFCDHWTDDLARMIGRISFANIRTDQSNVGMTMEMREPHFWATFYDAAYLFRRAQALKILNDPDCVTPLWQKDLLISCFPLIDARSRMINQQVRAQSQQLIMSTGNLPPDDRYRRIKARALEMIPHFLNDYGMPEQERQTFAAHLGVKL